MTLIWVGTALLAAVLAWLAAAAGLQGLDANPWLVALDVAVGLAFVGSALLAAGPSRMRMLVGFVGVAWLVGSIVDAVLLAHQGALVVVLVVFPTGRPRGLGAWIAVAAAMPVMLGLMPQWVVALIFAAVSLRSALRRPLASAAFPMVAAGAVALALGGSWLARSIDPFGYDPAVASVAYSVVLLLVAIGLGVATRAIEDRRLLRQRVLGEDGLTGLAGLEGVLVDVLGDPLIRVYRWDAAIGKYVDADGVPAPRGAQLRWLPIVDRSDFLGGVAHRSAALDDERTAAAVTDALRLALLNLRGRRELQRQLGELESAEARLLATVDRERAAVADRLRGDIVVRIGEAADALRDAVIESPPDDAADALVVALGELDGASDELMRLVDGIGPVGLGGGGLPSVLRDVAARSPLNVEIHAEAGAAGDTMAETALYYACLEAMVNAAKHASAITLRIAVRRRGDSLEAVVTDDGVGGADPGGSGLRGAADRLAASGGRLRVESPPAAGTTVTAEVPISRS